MVACGHPSTSQHADTATPAPSPQPECTWGHGQGLCFRSFNTCKIKCVSVQSAEGKGSPVSSESNLPCSSTRAVMMDSCPGQQRAASGAQCCSMAALCCGVGTGMGTGPVPHSGLEMFLCCPGSASSHSPVPVGEGCKEPGDGELWVDKPCPPPGRGARSGMATHGNAGGSRGVVWGEGRTLQSRAWGHGGSSGDEDEETGDGEDEDPLVAAGIMVVWEGEGLALRLHNAGTPWGCTMLEGTRQCRTAQHANHCSSSSRRCCRLRCAPSLWSVAVLTDPQRHHGEDCTVRLHEGRAGCEVKDNQSLYSNSP